MTGKAPDTSGLVHSEAEVPWIEAEAEMIMAVGAEARIRARQDPTQPMPLAHQAANSRPAWCARASPSSKID